jgi:hypothetical protein
MVIWLLARSVNVVVWWVRPRAAMRCHAPLPRSCLALRARSRPERRSAPATTTTAPARTVEQAVGLASMTQNDAYAQPMNDVFN